MNPKIALLLSR